MKTHPLNGAWRLYGCPPDLPEITSPKELSGRTAIVGMVPGNIELDLATSGVAGDPFVGSNALEYQKYNLHEWWYAREFDTPSDMRECTLVFEGVDTLGELFLNGEKLGVFDNAFISHRFRVVLKENGANELAVRIRPPAVMPMEEDLSSLSEGYQFTTATLSVRKPAHASGWDIAPCLNLGGLWKDVYLEKQDEAFRLEELYIQTLPLSSPDNAVLKLHYRYSTTQRDRRGLSLQVCGHCGTSSFDVEMPASPSVGYCIFEVKTPVWWWPSGYGEPSLYQLTGVLKDSCGREIARMESCCGLRKLELRRTELNERGQGQFAFYVNGVKIRIRGTNHVPADALHSRDPQRIPRILDMAKDLGCNMLRCWGGGVYEADAFYDFCDKNGILVWQDFMLACIVPPHHDSYADCFAREAAQVVRRLRRHPSLALWCGDNEGDETSAVYGIPPRTNRITRDVLPKLLLRLDPYRPYLPSSPYMTEEVWQEFSKVGFDALFTAFRRMPERHLWGSRDAFKSEFYNCGAKFISEIGWHGAPNASSIRRFITEEHLRIDPLDEEWDLHCSNAFGAKGIRHGRNRLMCRQQEEYYGKVIDTSLEDFARASQFLQAEALKYFVEKARLDAECNGILWWNLIDCWPQFSDSVVDYYFKPKLSYHYLKRSQKPFCIMCREPHSFHSEIVAVNDSSKCAKGCFAMQEAGSREVLLEGDFHVAPGEAAILGKVRAMRGKRHLWLVRWKLDDTEKGANHYVCGDGAMDYGWYNENLKYIAELDGSFDDKKIGH